MGPDPTPARLLTPSKKEADPALPRLFFDLTQLYFFEPKGKKFEKIFIFGGKIF